MGDVGRMGWVWIPPFGWQALQAQLRAVMVDFIAEEDAGSFGKFLGVDSSSILFNHPFQKPDPRLTWVFDGFLKRFGSPERMEMEGTPNSIFKGGWGFLAAPHHMSRNKTNTQTQEKAKNRAPQLP